VLTTLSTAAVTQNMQTRQDLHTQTGSDHMEQNATNTLLLTGLLSN